MVSDDYAWSARLDGPGRWTCELCGGVLAWMEPVLFAIIDGSIRDHYFVNHLNGAVLAGDES